MIWVKQLRLKEVKEFAEELTWYRVPVILTIWEAEAGR